MSGKIHAKSWALGVAVLALALTLALAPLPTRAHGGALELEVSPNELAAGDELTITGEGFGAGATLELVLTGPGGDAELGTATADEEGAFEQVVTVPGAVVPGLYLVRAANGEEATAELTVGAMPGMAQLAAEEEAAPERDRAIGWQLLVGAILVGVGALGLLLARPVRRRAEPSTPA